MKNINNIIVALGVVLLICLGICISQSMLDGELRFAVLLVAIAAIVAGSNKSIKSI